ncbi:MAG: DnaJ domain-containing protein [Bacteroidia bacterium]
MLYDYYKILDVPRTASLEEIKRAYRNKAKLIHPDINNSPKANEVFAVVNEAYETLSDDSKRYLHDIKLNFIDAEKANAERKKQYYGSSVKNDTYTNSTNFQNDLSTFSKAAYQEKTDADYYKQSPFIYNLFFASGMLIGFIIMIVTCVGTYKNYWPFPFIVIAVPGFILVREGWKGMMGKRNLFNGVIRRLRK